MVLLIAGNIDKEDFNLVNLLFSMFLYNLKVGLNFNLAIFLNHQVKVSTPISMSSLLSNSHSLTLACQISMSAL